MFCSARCSSVEELVGHALVSDQLARSRATRSIPTKIDAAEFRFMVGLALGGNRSGLPPYFPCNSMQRLRI